MGHPEGAWRDRDAGPGSNNAAQQLPK
jgi:hypothetical protein